MNSPTCQTCDCVKGCQSNPLPCPILLAECIASGQVSAAQIEAHRVLDVAIAQPEQTAFNIKEFTDRVFRMVDTVKFELEQNKLDAAISARLDVENFLLKNIAQPEQQTERNFCIRCGKRLAGDGIHTCTPPKDKP